MKYLKSFKSKTDAVGQSMPIPSVLSIDNMEDKVGYLNTDIGLKETTIVDTADESFVEGEYMWYTTVTYDVSSTTSTTQILYTTGNVIKMFYRGREIPVSTSYKFSETGKQSITFGFSNRKNITIDQFKGCKSIFDVQLGKHIKNIQAGSYSATTSLESISLSNNLVEIGASAFRGCVNLKEISIPDTVVRIGDYAFYSATSLANVTLGTSLISIGVRAFYGTAISEIIIPDSVKTIDDMAFYRCNNLTKIKLGSGIVRIGHDIISPENPMLEEYQSVLYLDKWAVGSTSSYVTSIREGTVGIADSATRNNNRCISLPNSLITIGKESLFMDSYPSYTITIPNSVKYIFENPFGNELSRLSDITIPESIIYFASQAANTSNATEENNILYKGKLSVEVSNTSADTYTIRDGTQIIGNACFFYCASLTGITIPHTVLCISNYAFQGCTSLTSIVIPDSVTSIGERAFYGCSALTTVNMGYRIREIGEYAFDGCTALNRINIPDSVYRINSYAFYECNRLSAITIPDSVNFIESGAFQNCRNVKNITIGAGLKSLASDAFYGIQISKSNIINHSTLDMEAYNYGGATIIS